jgi:hypothetical protein
MRQFLNSTMAHGNVLLASAVVGIAVAAFLAVPAFLTMSSVVWLTAAVAVFTWIVRTTHLNAQPARNLARALYEPDDATRDRARASRRGR